MKRRMVLIALLLLFTAGCVQKGDRALNNQNKEIGEYIVANAVDPAMKQAGKDLVLNATTLEKNCLGASDNPQPYSPAASEKARQQSEEEHAVENKIFGTLTGWLLSILGAIGCAGIGGAVMKYIVSARLMPLIISLFKATDKVKSAHGVDKITEVYKETQREDGVLANATKLYKKYQADKINS